MTFLDHQHFTNFNLNNFLKEKVRNTLKLSEEQTLVLTDYCSFFTSSGVDLAPSEQAELNIADNHTISLGINQQDQIVCVIHRGMIPEVYCLENLPRGTYKIIINIGKLIDKDFSYLTPHLKALVSSFYVGMILTDREKLIQLLAFQEDELEAEQQNIINFFINVFNDDDDDDETDFPIIDLIDIQQLTTFHLPALANKTLLERLNEDFSKLKHSDPKKYLTIFSTTFFNLSFDDRIDIELEHFEHLDISIDRRNRLIAQIYSQYDDIDYDLKILLEQLPKGSYKLFKMIFEGVNEFHLENIEDQPNLDNIISKVFINIAIELMGQRHTFYTLLGIKKIKYLKMYINDLIFQNLET